MKVDVLNIEGKSTGRSVELPEEIFGVTPNEHCVYLAVKAYNASQRQGTHKAKERGEVSRTTKKFKRQKGTGGARAGSLRSPIFKGGGTVFGPRPRNYRIKLNDKVKKVARYSALSDKAQKGGITVIENFSFDTPKTKNFVNMLGSLGMTDKKVLFVLEDYNDNIYLSGRNIPQSQIVTASDLNTYEILNANQVVLLEGSIDKLQ